MGEIVNVIVLILYCIFNCSVWGIYTADGTRETEGLIITLLPFLIVCLSC